MIKILQEEIILSKKKRAEYVTYGIIIGIVIGVLISTAISFFMWVDPGNRTKAGFDLFYDLDEWSLRA